MKIKIPVRKGQQMRNLSVEYDACDAESFVEFEEFMGTIVEIQWEKIDRQ